MKSFFILFLLFVSLGSIACTCETISKIDKQAVIQAKDIFIGRVSKVEPIDNLSRKITFQIIERLKTDSMAQISIFTGLGGADCGLNIKEGQEWYIFTFGDNGKSWGELCGRSALLSQHSIPPNPYRKKYYKQAVRQYNKNKARAQVEVRYIQNST